MRIDRDGGFREILGIEIADLEYLAEALRAGILTAPTTNVRANAPVGALCEARIPVGGLREHRDRTVAVTTSWEQRHAGDAPRVDHGLHRRVISTSTSTTEHAISEHDIVVLRTAIGA